MWSFGVIMHELIKLTLRGFTLSLEDFIKQRYLFKGTSCFPISPAKNQNDVEIESED